MYIDNEVDIDNRKVEASAYAKGLSSVLSKMEPGEVPEYVAKALAIKGMIMYQEWFSMLTRIDLPVRDQAAIIDAFRAWSLSASLGTTEKLSLVLNMVQSASDIPQQDGYVRLRNELIKTFNCKSKTKQCSSF